MKFCITCGAQNEDSASFCSSCGATFPDVSGNHFRKLAQPEAPEVTMPSTVSPETAAKLAQAFKLASGERVIAFIGNNYLQNLLAGEPVAKTVAVATNRRLYYQGRLFKDGVKLSRDMESGSVLLKDITYTGMKHRKSVWKLVFACILAFFAASALTAISESLGGGIFGILLCGIPAFLLFKSYNDSLANRFVVYFPGGGLMFDMKYYSAEECGKFQETLTRLVDQTKG